MAESATALERLVKYETPVVYATNRSNNIYHVPEIDGETVQTVCGKGVHMHVTSLSLFQRRRNPRICEICEEKTPSDGYPETAPVG